jgi:hypothetical protein
MAKIILIFSFFFLFSCKENKQEEKSFTGYNIEFYSDRIGTYNFNKNVFEIPKYNYYPATYSNYLTKAEQKKIITKFFEYNLASKKGELDILEEPYIDPSSGNTIRLFKNGKKYYFAYIGLHHPKISFFMKKEKKELIRFNDFMDSLISSKKQYKEASDSINNIIKKKNILIM